MTFSSGFAGSAAGLPGVTSAPGANAAVLGVLVAPQPPGRLGEAAAAGELLSYLGELSRWREHRKNELDRLDDASMRSSDPDGYTEDISLSMALWQSVNERESALITLWDNGRADQVAREKMSQLIWGRRDSAGASGAMSTGGLSLSLVEASRLCDALAAQLRARLSFDPSAAESTVRVAALRAAMQRCRELVKQEPTWSPQIEVLATRVDDVATRAARGADVDSPLIQLESDAAKAERDLIVSTATRLQRERGRERAAADQARDLAADRVRATSQVAALEHREVVVRELAQRCAREIVSTPRLAVPEVDVLGPVPQDRPALDAFLARLSDVTRAMDIAEAAYTAPPTERDELRGLLNGYRVMAARRLRDGDPEVAAAAQRARAAVQAVPCDLVAARSAVSEYQRLVRPSGGSS